MPSTKISKTVYQKLLEDIAGIYDAAMGGGDNLLVQKPDD